MADICLLCASEDISALRTLVSALRANVGSVWWMDDITDGNWARHANREVRDSKIVIPIWTNHSVADDCEVLSELAYARKIGKKILPISIEQVIPPIPWTDHHKIELKKNNRSNATDWKEVIDGVSKLIGTPKLLGDKSILAINRSNRFNFPLFAFSVSSFETAIGPDDALRTLSLFPKLECCLISAYDLIDHSKKKGKSNSQILMNNRIRAAKALRKRGVKILLDSGNYEAFRKGERLDYDFAEKFKQDKWKISDFRTVLESSISDISFGFDTPGGIRGKHEAIERAIKSFELCKSSPEKIAPIVHLPRYKDGTFDTSAVAEIMTTVASSNNFNMIAIPERELGDGIVERAIKVKEIREALNINNQQVALHLLGTGNPISLAMYAGAGADSFDGLEWCRTVCDRITGLLFHLQQYDFFASQAELSDSNVVKSACENPNVGFLVKVALHNIDSFSEWVSGVRLALLNGKLWEFISDRVGPLLKKEMKTALERVVS